MKKYIQPTTEWMEAQAESLLTSSETLTIDTDITISPADADARCTDLIDWEGYSGI